MPFLEKFDGLLLQEFSDALARDEENQVQIRRMLKLRNLETEFERLVRVKRLSPESAKRVHEALEALGDEALEHVEHVSAFGADDLDSMGILVGEHRYVVRLYSANPARRSRRGARPVHRASPAAVIPRVVKAGQKRPSEPDEVVPSQAEAPESETVARFFGPGLRPKPKGRFSSGGQLEGMKPPEG